MTVKVRWSLLQPLKDGRFSYPRILQEVEVAFSAGFNFEVN